MRNLNLRVAFLCRPGGPERCHLTLKSIPTETLPLLSCACNNRVLASPPVHQTVSSNLVSSLGGSCARQVLFVVAAIGGGVVCRRSTSCLCCERALSPAAAP